MGFVDWNPAPPDKNMGIWREVRVKATGDVSIDAPFVRTKLDLEAFKEASLTVSAELKNNAANKVSGTLEGRLESSDVLAGRDPGAEGNEEDRLRARDDPRARAEEPEGLVDP